ncbi:MAG: MoxR family ATPase [Magnetococcales bacterium]|nr:MoxR family ATPase [Magnetococcales bacterium]
MKINPYYTGIISKPAQQKGQEKWRTLPFHDLKKAEDPEGYVANDRLIQAVNVALILGRPLLLTGEPGVGKSSLAAHVAAELGLDLIKYRVTSQTTGTDLFYKFDYLGEFRDAQSRRSVTEPEMVAKSEMIVPATTDGTSPSSDNPPAMDQQRMRFIQFQALGKAILLANEWETVQDLWQLGRDEFKGPARTLVLIDEIDKAPRDVPNDILNDLEEMKFYIPQLSDKENKGNQGREVSAPKELRPIVILTSNSEKNLPDAFLRRCVYFDIRLEKEKLPEIVANRIKDGISKDCPLLKDCLELFSLLRQDGSGIRKKPSTAELLNWLHWLRSTGLAANDSLKKQKEANLLGGLSCLVKSREDWQLGEQILTKWLGQS